MTTFRGGVLTSERYGMHFRVYRATPAGQAAAATVLAADVPCRETDPELFHPVTDAPGGACHRQIAAAKAICGRCPVTAACLRWALEEGFQGVWGMTTDRERRAIRRRPGSPRASGDD